jgi:hypothetical protein
MFIELSKKQAVKRCFVPFLALFLFAVSPKTSRIAIASEKSAFLSGAESAYQSNAGSISEFLSVIQTHNNGRSVRGSDERQSSEELTAAHGCDPYVSGENLTVSAAVTYSGLLTAIGARISLPSGWVPVNVTAWGITLEMPEDGNVSTGSDIEKWWGAKFVSPDILEIYWIDIPPNPIDFGYTVAVPNDESEARKISSEVLYRRLGGEELAIIAPDPLTVRPFSSDEEPVCKDSDADGVIDQWDLCSGTPADSWVNKNGCRAEGLYTEDQMNQMVQAVLTWGDVSGDGKISLSEVINALRTLSGVTEPAVK